MIKNKLDKEKIFKQQLDKAELFRKNWAFKVLNNIIYYHFWKKWFYNNYTWNITFEEEQNIYIAIIKQIINNIINTVTKNDPRFSIKNLNYNSTNKEEIVAQKILDLTRQENKLRKKIKKIIYYYLTYWLGIAHVTWSTEKLLPKINIINPFNVFFDPYWKIENWQFLGDYIIIRQSVSPKKIQEKYKIQLKNNLDMIDYLKIIDFLKWNTNKENYYIYIKYEIINWKLNKQIFIDWKLIEETILDLDFYPFVFFKKEEEESIYTISHLDYMLEVATRFNEIFNNINDKIKYYEKWIFLKPEWTKISIKKIDKKWLFPIVAEYTGTPPQIMPAPIDPNVFQFMNYLEKYIYDIWWIHPQSLGMTLWKSWLQLAQAQAADYMNITNIGEDLKVWLEQLAITILKISAIYLNDFKKLTIEDKEFKIIGQEYYEKLLKIYWNIDWNLIPLKPFENIIVEIYPGIVYNDQQVFNQLIQLKSLWIDVPEEMIIDSAAVWTYGALLKEYYEKQKKEQENPDIQIAKAENIKLAQWQQIAVDPSDNDKIHLQYHLLLLQQLEQNQQTNEEILNNIIEHINQHKINLQKKQYWI